MIIILKLIGLSWTKKISGNKPFSGLYVHGLANSFIAIMPTLTMQKNMPQTRFWIWVTLTLFIGIIITVLREKSRPACSCGTMSGVLKKQ